jgi:hypothetical protein
LAAANAAAIRLLLVSRAAMTTIVASTAAPKTNGARSPAT